ncbi:hypothetical protein Tco_0703981 [Tanacetum coccineum]|uniref:CCHC-type domain-containing protein n=1 Tax=Tanacetum coccineum TaxID=301880 RepID=A0ABQ4Y252_9ASTR
MTARKRVRPLPDRRLAWRRVSPRSSDHRPSSSSSSLDSSAVHSSGLDAPDQAHSGSSTRDVSPRLCYPLRRAPRHSEAFHRWCAAPLSTLYPLTTSESSSGDSSKRPLHSSSHSAGPSRKKYSYSSEASIEEDTEVDPIETEVDMELGIGDGDDVRDYVEIDPRDVRDDTEEYEADTSAGDTVEVGINPMSAPIVKEEIVEPPGDDSSDSSGTRDDIVRLFEDMPIDLDDAVRDFYHHMFERRLEADQLIARGERAGMIERVESLRLENLKVRAMLDIERDRVNSLRLHMSLSQEEFRQVRRDRDDTQGRLRRLESTMTNTCSEMTPAAIKEMINQRVDEALEARRVNRDLGLGNGNDNGGGDGNENDTGNGNNGGDNGDGNENPNMNRRGDRPGARELINWWNSHKRTFGTDAATLFSWRELLKAVTEVVLAEENEIKNVETVVVEFVLVKNQLTWLLHKEMGLLYERHRLQDVVQIANHLMDKKLKGYAVRNAENRRRLDNNYRDNYGQQPPHKRHNTRVGHMTRDCRAVIATTTQGTSGPNQRVITCFECGAQGHYRKGYPKVKNQNRRNKARVPDARGKAYILGGGDANPGSNIVTDVSYVVELADERTLEKPFPSYLALDLVSKEFMTVIVCDEKIVRIPYEKCKSLSQETKVIRRDINDGIISCVKASEVKRLSMILAKIESSRIGNHQDLNWKLPSSSLAVTTDDISKVFSKIAQAYNEADSEKLKVQLGVLAQFVDAEGRQVIDYASRQLKIHEKKTTRHIFGIGSCGIRVEHEKRRWLELVKLYDCEFLVITGERRMWWLMRLSQKSRPKALRVRAWLWTIWFKSCADLE